ncbi:hypothetical protein AVEN_17406-1 [Araneus ventricosus]|uniref:Uncharacterized protein n=1 Tax=Araneus ventricosus TaxID=182803 RepID=A0A4Y2GZX5_ARAVE|nr:hypothetical protein AVEN_17406-1 [Araneus ventricosus]
MNGPAKGLVDWIIRSSSSGNADLVTWTCSSSAAASGPGGVDLCQGTILDQWTWRYGPGSQGPSGPSGPGGYGPRGPRASAAVAAAAASGPEDMT